MGTPISSAVLVAKGFRSSAGLKKNPNAWGTKAVAVGAGDGIEIDQQTMVPTVALIQNDAATGPISRRAGVKGNEEVAGDIGPCPLYYRGLELPIALALGTGGTPTLVSGTAYQHKFRLANSHKGLYASFVFDPYGSDAGPDGPIWEYPHVKITGLKIEQDQGAMAKITFPATAYGINYNIGTPDPVTIVAAAVPSNGVKTIAAQPGKARKLTVTVADADSSVTEFWLTIVGTDRNGNAITEIYKLTVNGKVYTTSNAFRTITSITGSALAGTTVGDTVAVTTANVVRPVQIANGTLTLDAQPGEPSQLLLTIVDADSSVTEAVATITGTSADGNAISEVYRLSLNGGPGSHTYTTVQTFDTVTSVVISGVTGTAAAIDTIGISCANGINNRNTVSAITYPTRDQSNLVIFAQLESFLINDQAGSALVAADLVNNQDNDEFMISKYSVDLNLNATTQEVNTTSRYGTRIEEPITGGAGFAETKISLSFSKSNTRNYELLKRQLSKKPLKIKITYTGGAISGGGGASFKMEIYLNNVQFDSGSPTMSGPGVMAFDLSGSAYQANSVPSGFPANLVEPIGIDLTTTLATDPLA